MEKSLVKIIFGRIRSIFPKSDIFLQAYRIYFSYVSKLIYLQPKLSNMSFYTSKNSTDRIIGLLTVIAGGFAYYVVRNWIRNQNLIGRVSLFMPSKRNFAIMQSNGFPKESTVLHNGSCHCQRIQFRVRAPSVIKAVDIPSKIRFPRLTVPYEFFETVSDERFLSLYTVRYGRGIGVHSFCRYCGVHVVYSPSINPTDVQVNANCLDKSNISDMIITYHGTEDPEVTATAEDVAATALFMEKKRLQQQQCDLEASMTPNQSQPPSAFTYATTGVVCTNVYLSEDGVRNDDGEQVEEGSTVGTYHTPVAQSLRSGLMGHSLFATWAGCDDADRTDAVERRLGYRNGDA